MQILSRSRAMVALVCLFAAQPLVAYQVNVVNLADGSARFVTNGTAYDWHTR